MRKNLLIPSTIVLVVVACTIFMNDGFTYLILSLMALSIVGSIHRNHSWVMNITRWAKTNPRKTQVLITVLQLALTVMGITAGYNLKKLGYEFSNSTAFVFSTILVIGFLSVPFLPKKSVIAIPKEVNKHRLAYMSIALSSFVMMVVFGNRIEEAYPNSVVAHALEAMDKAVFPDDNTGYVYLKDVAVEPMSDKNYNEGLSDQSSTVVSFASFSIPEKEATSEKKLTRSEKKKLKLIEKYRLAYGAALSAGAVLLIMLLAILTCAGICLTVGGFVALFGGEALGILAILGGGVITWQSIKGIRKIRRNNR